MFSMLLGRDENYKDKQNLDVALKQGGSGGSVPSTETFKSSI